MTIELVDIMTHYFTFLNLRMGISRLEVDAINRIYENLPRNSVIYSEEETEACQRHPSFEMYNVNSFETSTVRKKQLMRLQYVFQSE